MTGIGLLLVAWATLVHAGHVAIPPLSEVLSQLREVAGDGVLLRDAWASLQRVLEGVGVALLFTLLLGVPAALWPPVGHVLEGVVELLRPIPPLAWVPVAILAFGVGDKPAVAIVALGAFFPVWLGLHQGLAEVRRQHLLAARSFGASRWLQLTDVVVPTMLPFGFHGLRLGLGLGWFCVVAAELMGANSGLGYGVQLHSLNLQLGRTYVYIFSIALLGAANNFGMRWLELRLFRWRQLDVGHDD